MSTRMNPDDPGGGFGALRLIEEGSQQLLQIKAVIQDASLFDDALSNASSKTKWPSDKIFVSE